MNGEDVDPADLPHPFSRCEQAHFPGLGEVFPDPHCSICYRAPGHEIHGPVVYRRGRAGGGGGVSWRGQMCFSSALSRAMSDLVRHPGERHAECRVETIERCIRLWSNGGEVVFDPFAGIGSTGYVALQKRRRFVGIELKPSYFNQAAKNLAAANSQYSLFPSTTTEGAA